MNMTIVMTFQQMLTCVRTFLYSELNLLIKLVDFHELFSLLWLCFHKQVFRYVLGYHVQLTQHIQHTQPSIPLE